MIRGRTRGLGTLMKAAVKLGRGHQFDEQHAMQVTGLALSLFDQLTGIHKLSGENKKLLLAASVLHDIGAGISAKGHHKHSFSLILASDLPGLSKNEKLVAANIARYHRKNEPRKWHAMYSRLTLEDKDTVQKLSAILRIADGLDRSHLQRVQSLTVSIKKKAMTMNVHADGDITAETWALRKKTAMFEKVYGLPLNIVEV